MQVVSISEWCPGASREKASMFRVAVEKPSVDTKFGIIMTSLCGVVTVRSLTPDSALKAQGLAVGDEILEINGVKVDGAVGARESIAAAPVGQLVLQAQRFKSNSLEATKEVMLPKAKADSSMGITLAQSGLVGQLLVESVSDRVAELKVLLSKGDALFSISGVELVDPAQAEEAWKAAPIGEVRLVAASVPYHPPERI